MQTFLPHPDFAASARCLDNRRLGKQRVEGMQIMKACIYKSSWGNHPAVLMWRGYERALHLYVQDICIEWVHRGFRDTCSVKTRDFCTDEGVFQDELIMPPWLGREDFHLAHRSNLVRKDPVFYGRLWPDVPADLPYVWPVTKETGR